MIEPINIFEDTEVVTQTPWYKRVLFVIVYTIGCAVAAIYMMKMVRNQSSPNSIINIKRRFKYFTPTITERWYGKKITWTERPKPLTELEMKEFV